MKNRRKKGGKNHNLCVCVCVLKKCALLER